MPELPEVETIRRDLIKKILDIEILDIEILLPRIVKSDIKEFKHRLIGNRYGKIERIGKLLVFYPVKGACKMLVHLKMTGQLIYQKGSRMIAGGHSDSQPFLCLPCAHTRAVIAFADGSRLYFNDLRTFGYLKLADDGEIEKIRGQYGPEPLLKDFRLEDFLRSIKKRKTTIKAVLLNQEIVAGLGNIYVDEVLFRAGVRPGRKASGLKKAEIEGIYKAIKPVLKSAIKHRGTTFNNYRDADGNRGSFVNRLNVYGRAGEKCKKCGSVILKTKVAGRGTHYCSVCQK
jgi:formamidopyrimidine-DNA glycosylase